jgi:uncharacterized FlaG/YvyC family protein
MGVKRKTQLQERKTKLEKEDQACMARVQPEEELEKERKELEAKVEKLNSVMESVQLF